MNTERDKFLTEAMGGIWLTTLNMGMVKGPSCDEATTTRFSNWSGFGKLWEWAQKQGFWLKMAMSFQQKGFYHFIHPDNFANEIYEHLKTKG